VASVSTALTTHIRLPDRVSLRPQRAFEQACYSGLLLLQKRTRRSALVLHGPAVRRFPVRMRTVGDRRRTSTLPQMPGGSALDLIEALRDVGMPAGSAFSRISSARLARGIARLIAHPTSTPVLNVFDDLRGGIWRAWPRPPPHRLNPWVVIVWPRRLADLDSLTRNWMML
jgi:hypothetical protein